MSLKINLMSFYLCCVIALAQSQALANSMEVGGQDTLEMILNVRLQKDPGEQEQLSQVEINSGIGDGKNSVLVYPTALGKVLADAKKDEGMNDLKMISQIVMSAYNDDKVSRDEFSRLRGYNFALGLGSAVTWNDRLDHENANENDFFGTIGVLGTSARANVYKNGFNIQAEFGFYGDVVMVKSYSLSKSKQEISENFSDFSNANLGKGYYWGLGTSTVAGLSIHNGNWAVGYNGLYSNAETVVPLRRQADDLFKQEKLKDEIYTNKIYGTYSLNKNLRLRLIREIRFRNGSTGQEFDSGAIEAKTSGMLVFQFK